MTVRVNAGRRSSAESPILVSWTCRFAGVSVADEEDGRVHCDQFADDPGVGDRSVADGDEREIRERQEDRDPEGDALEERQTPSGHRHEFADEGQRYRIPEHVTAVYRRVSGPY